MIDGTAVRALRCLRRGSSKALADGGEPPTDPGGWVLRRRVSRVRLRAAPSPTALVSSALVICRNNSRNPSGPLGPVRVIGGPSFRHAHEFVLPLKADIRASLTGPR